jgi:membrane associated rhomboid family serine protease
MNRHYEISDDDHQPLTWVQGRPLYAAHVIVAALVATMLVTTVLLALGARAPLAALAFDSVAVFGGQVWRVLSYGLVNIPSIGFALEMVLLAKFGREVEHSLGRRSFLRLYAYLYFIPPLVLTLVGVWQPQSLSGQSGAFAIFVAFATLYPGAALLFNLLAGWVAFILVALFSLIALAGRDWPGLVALWSTTGFAYAYVRHAQGHFNLPSPRLPALRRAPAPTPADPREARPASASRPRPAPSPSDDMPEVDALLDKINRSGLASLTPQERARLSAAQARLARRHDRPAR